MGLRPQGYYMIDYKEFDGNLYPSEPDYMVIVDGISMGICYGSETSEADYKKLCDCNPDSFVQLVKIFALYNLENDTFDYGHSMKITVKTSMDKSVE